MTRQWHPYAMLWLGAVLILACSEGALDDRGPAEDIVAAPEVLAPIEVQPAPPVMARLTQAQYINAVRDLFGTKVVAPSTLEPDTEVEGLFAVGATIASLSPRGVELYEQAAQSLAAQVVADEALRQSLHPCMSEAEQGDNCLEQVVRATGRRIWRRALAAEEVESLVSLGRAAEAVLGDPNAGVQFVLLALLQAPDFLYRLELGEVAPLEGAPKRYRDDEMASRLSVFLWNSIPDDELLDAAEKGELTTEEGLAAQVTRMMASPKVRQAVRNFFTEWLELHALDSVSKDPKIFKHSSADLGDMAREETLSLAEHLVFEKNADLRSFLTTNTTFVNRRLAAIYNVPAVTDEGFGRIELPVHGPRRGFLGHVSFLSLHAHPVSSSATLRGLFVREKLLCMNMPPPPAGLNTAVPEASEEAKTLKERLIVHMEDPSCAGCHAMTDVIGFAFERFDGVGLFRVEENGGQIDPTGDLDGTPFANAVEVAEIIAEDERFLQCVVHKLYSYATGHEPAAGEADALDRLAAEFQLEGNILDLMAEIAMSKPFRLVGEVTP